MVRVSACSRWRVAGAFVVSLIAMSALTASVAASSAAAASLSLSVSGTPQPGQVLTLTSTGSADKSGAVRSYLDKASACATTRRDESMRIGSGQVVPVDSHQVSAAGRFSFMSHLAVPAPGSYLVCGYLTTLDNPDGTPSPAAFASTPIDVPSPPSTGAPPPTGPPLALPAPTSPPMVASSLSPPTLQLDGGSISGTTATITLTCRGATGQVCSAVAQLSSNERLRGVTPVAVTARKKAPRKKSLRKRALGKTQRVTDATANYSAVTGTSTAVRLTLNAVARRLLTRFKRLSSTLSLNGTAVDTVTFVAAKPTKPATSKKKPRKRGPR